MPKLLQLCAIHPNAQTRLDAGYAIVRANLAEIDAAWLGQHATRIEGVVTGGHLGIPSALMTGLPNLKIVAINGVGYDKVDLDLARQRGVRVCNTPDVQPWG